MEFDDLCWSLILSFTINYDSSSLDYGIYRKLKSLKRKLDIDMNIKHVHFTNYYSNDNPIYYILGDIPVYIERGYNLPLRRMKYDFVKENKFYQKKIKIIGNLYTNR
jgi:hypothetical protein